MSGDPSRALPIDGKSPPNLCNLPIPTVSLPFIDSLVRETLTKVMQPFQQMILAQSQQISDMNKVILDQSQQLLRISEEMQSIKSSVSPATLRPHLYSAIVESTYRDKDMLIGKGKRAVIIGLPEGKSEDDTCCKDKDLISRLIIRLNSADLIDDLEKGNINHHRHPIDRPRLSAPHGRPLKIEFSSLGKRNLFLELCRKAKHPFPKGCYSRADLSPAELQAESDCIRISTNPSFPPAKVVDAHLIPAFPRFAQSYKRVPYRPISPPPASSSLSPLASSTQHSQMPSSSLVNSGARSTSTFEASSTDFPSLAESSVKPLQVRSRRITRNAEESASCPRKSDEFVSRRRNVRKTSRYSP